MDHATVNRWVITYNPPRADACPRRKRPVWISGRLDETYIRVNRAWRDLSRAVDTPGQTVDLLLMEHRDHAAALGFLTPALRRHGVPETSTLAGRDAHEAALKRDNAAHGPHSSIRQVKYWPTMVEPDHRRVTRGTRPRRGFTALAAAHATLVGMALMPRRTTHQLRSEEGGERLTAAEQFDALAAS